MQHSACRQPHGSITTMDGNSKGVLACSSAAAGALPPLPLQPPPPPTRAVPTRSACPELSPVALISTTAETCWGLLSHDGLQGKDRIAGRVPGPLHRGFPAAEIAQNVLDVDCGRLEERP